LDPDSDSNENRFPILILVCYNQIDYTGFTIRLLVGPRKLAWAFLPQRVFGLGKFESSLLAYEHVIHSSWYLPVRF
jgi:hypothetical protein